MSGNITTIHHSLNRGEVSPRIAARQDKPEFYMAGCLTMQNAIPLVAGGAYWRPGTQRVATKKDVEDHDEIRLIDFVAARTAAYVLEFGHRYIRIYRNGSLLFEGDGINANTVSKRFSMLNFGMPWDEPLPFADGLIASEDRFQLLGLYGIDSTGEITSPYAGEDLADIITVQSIDVMYLFHRFYPVHKITRISETEFILTEVNFNPPATIEEEPTGEELGGGTLTPAAVTGTGIDFTAQNAVWLGSGTASSHVGQIIVSGASRAQIVSVTSTTVVVADIIDDFIDTSPISSGDWRLKGSPNALLDVDNKRTDAGQVITITARNLANNADLDTFRLTDVGKYIALFGGTVRIDAFTDASHVKATILVDLNDIESDNPDPTAAWTMEITAWSTELGFPSAGCFYQGRLYILKGLTINGSVTGDYENFGKGSNDDDAIARTIDDDDVDAGVWIKGDDSLKVATGSGIYQCLPTTQGGALTPRSFQVKPIDPNGAARIAPIRVMPVLLYVDANKRLIRELGYEFSSDKFKSPNVFQFAEHLVDGFFISELTYAKDPHSIVYAVRSDGVLLGLVYDTLQSVIAWFRIVTDGLIKSVAVIPRPSTGKDWVWLAVERENGIFIEHFEPDHADTGREWDDLQTDCAIVTTHSAGFVVSGLDHLEGQTVQVLGDGQLFNIERNELGRIVSTAVVTDGQITLDPEYAVSKVEVGLGFEGRIVPVEPLVPAELGGPMIQHAYAEVGVVIRRALGLTLRAYRVNMTEPGDDTLVGEQLVYRKPYHPMDAQVPLQQGKKCVTTLGYDPFARIEVGRSLPFPAEILNIHGRLHVGDRWDCETYNDGIPEVEAVVSDDVVAFGHCLTPFMSAFPWRDGSGFGAKFSDPSTLPEEATADLAFSPDGDAVGVATFIPFVTGIGLGAWEWIGDGWGAKYAAPASTPPVGDVVNVWGVAFSPNGDIAFSVEQSMSIFAYPWSSDTGFGTKYANPGVTPAASTGKIAFSPAGDAIISTRNSGPPHVEAYAWTEGVGFGAKYSNPGSPPANFTGAKGLSFSPSGVDVAISYSATPWVQVYPWDAVTGFGTKYANPGVLPPNGFGRDVEFSPSGEDIAVAHHASPFVTAYPWTEGVGFGTKYSDPATLPGNTGISIAFSPSGGALLVGCANPSEPLVTAYAWTPGVGFGAKFTDTAAVLPDDATSIAFRQGA